MDLWSRRKAAVEAEAIAEVKAEEAIVKAEVEAVQAEQTDEELLEQLGLPDPETLGEGADFKQFMGDAIPARLKTRALRRLWSVNPLLANIDGLVDYGEDFTDAAMCVENMQSAYQVGKGMMAHVEELARQAEQEAAVEDGDAEAEQVVEEPMVDPVRPPQPQDKEAVLAFAAQSAQDEEPFQPEWDETPEDAASAPMPGSRRMTFTFDDQRTG